MRIIDDFLDLEVFSVAVGNISERNAANSTIENIKYQKYETYLVYFLSKAIPLFISLDIYIY